MTPLEKNLLSGRHHMATASISELRVTIDLMTKGYDVFRQVCPCSLCDLIAIKENEVRRIEVRTCNKSANGRVYKTYGKKDHIEAIDYYAFVTPTGIEYVKHGRKEDRKAED